MERKWTEALSRNSAGSDRAPSEEVIGALILGMDQNGSVHVPVEYDPEDRNKFRVQLMTADGDLAYLPVYSTGEDAEAAGVEEYQKMALADIVQYVLFEDMICGLFFYHDGNGYQMNKGLIWDVMEGKQPDEKDAEFYRGMIEKAVDFALLYHSGQIRKGTEDPYITHPLEVLSIMNSMDLSSEDPRLTIAGILHDVVEDTDATLELIRWRFGRDVAALVEAHTEDKTKTWQERKEQLINELPEADRRVKLLILSDVLANLRTMQRDRILVGEQLWNRFRAPKERQEWYFRNIKDILSRFEEEKLAGMKYREMVEIYKDLFSEDS